MIPVRVKIIGIVALALALSLGAFLWVGNSAFYEDKSAYIYDYNLTQVQLAAKSVETQIQKATLFFRLMDTYSTSDTKGIESLFSEASTTTGIQKLLILSMDTNRLLKPELGLQDDDHGMVSVLDQLGWDSLKFRSELVLVGRVATGELAIGIFSKGKNGIDRAYLALAKPMLGLSKSANADFQIHLLDSVGESLYSNSKKKSSIHFEKLLEALDGSHFSSGARRWNSKDESYLIAYQHLAFKEFTVVGLIPEAKAFSGITQMMLKSVVLGLGILLLTSGFTLLFVRQIIEGLRQMAIVTEKVAQGTFSFRVNTGGMKNDEIGLLARSFNAMADKIQDLMVEIEVKSEEKHSLEQTQAVQGNLFPKEAFSHANLNFMGASLFSSQCGGDWWHYDQIGDYLVVIVGKVDGRGLTAAMSTAIARGAASGFLATTRLLPKGAAPNFKLLVNQLNSAAFDCTQGRQPMRCFVGIVDLHSGILQSFNCGFPPPLLRKLASRDEFQTLTPASHAPLGSASSIEFETHHTQLEPGDVILWYSPSLVEVRNTSLARLELATVQAYFMNLHDNYQAQSKKLAEGLLSKTTEFLGEVVGRLPDDITVVVASIPKTAYFVQRVKTDKAA